MQPRVVFLIGSSLDPLAGSEAYRLRTLDGVAAVEAWDADGFRRGAARETNEKMK